MTCSSIKVNGASVIVCHKGPPLQQCCAKGCEEIAAFECDWKIAGGRTCDAPMCEAHRFNVSKNKDLCYDHHEAWKDHPANKQQALGL